MYLPINETYEFEIKDDKSDKNDKNDKNDIVIDDKKEKYKFIPDNIPDNILDNIPDNIPDNILDNIPDNICEEKNILKYPCVVENGYNTCYIDSLLIALFYKNNNYIYSLLDLEPKNPESYYLQGLIKLKFVDPIKRNFSISSSIINEIRNYSIMCGWSQNEDIDEQKDCSEYYNFLVNLFNIELIEFEIIQIKNNKTSITTTSLPFIPLSLTKDDSVKNILDEWINSQFLINNENVYQCYKLINIPKLIILHINRFNNNFIRTSYKLDIMKRIKFCNISDNEQNYLKWKIHSIICHSGNSIKSGHYYSIIYTEKKWLKFDDMLVPSFEQIDLEDNDNKEKIMLESIMLIYTLDI
jgi:ubiquitin C-terminal hydrolase